LQLMVKYREYMYRFCIFIILISLIEINLCFAQQERSDSLQTAIPDSILLDSLRIPQSADSQKTSGQADFEGPIKYWADNIHLSYDGNIIKLDGNAKIEYTNLTLEAAKIKIDRNSNLLFAEGVADSVDSLGQVIYKGTPVFKESGEEPLEGNFIRYDFNTKRGKITYGKTKMDPGFYKGERINKISERTLLVEEGYFTSCENIDDPHFYFKSKQMRVVFKDKVIARPIVFYIADVPLMALPFGIFPNKRGRHSGLIIPSYGENKYGGRFLRGLGYYWAPNDYMDATFQTDFYDKLGFTYRSNFRYTVRYLLNGSVSGEYYPKDPTTGQRKERWRFNFRHNQTVDPTLSISGSGSFQSDKSFVRETSPNIEDRLNQKITSNLSVRKKWKGTKNSMTASLSRTENLQTERVDYTLPNVSFNRSQSSIYESITGNKLGAKRNWYQNVYFSYNSNLVRKGQKIKEVIDDSTSSFKISEKSGVRHRLSFNSPQRVLKYFNLNPTLNYTEDWVNEVNTAKIDEETGEVVFEKEKQFASRRTFNTGMQAKTTLYGLFEPNIGKIKFIRHKMDPSVSYTFTPDFSSPFYGYYDSIEDSTGEVIEYDRFQGTTFGSTSRSQSQRMNMNLNNVFQAKLLDEEGEEKKVDLFTLNFSTGYNFKADSLKWSNLSTSFRTRVFGKSFNLRAVHSFYKNKSGSSALVDEFVFDKDTFLPRLVSANASFAFGLSNKTFERKEEKKKERSRRDIQETPVVDSLAIESDDEGILNTDFDGLDRETEREKIKKVTIPWSVNMNFNYNINSSNPNNTRETLNISTRANIQLTKNWKISWNGRFDLITKELLYQNFNIYRDLHCWEMSLGWQPERGYYDFRINVKSSVLQDIKLTKSASNSQYIPRY